ncbi:MAG: sulfatase activating formylglycine-generating enzyme [Planctomycetota bacterium]|jgi:formylglycine-generating enzyme required for sulfatase activity
MHQLARPSFTRRIQFATFSSFLGLTLTSCGSGDGAEPYSVTEYSSVEVGQLWETAIQSISNPDECPLYNGLEMTPIEGLVPLGRDPYSNLWEFGHTRTGKLATRPRGAGVLELTEATGLVFVLIPGGSFWMGSQRTDPDGINFDPRAQPVEQPVHEVSLSPFFISKYEMTQAQWLTINSVNTSYYPPGSNVLIGVHLLHPIEGNSWNECIEAFKTTDLLLPTEAQWEYAARAGTDTPWSTGRIDTDLIDVANLADIKAPAGGGPKDWDYVTWADPWAMHAPVGQLQPNAFGLHDIHGNLWEWCRDAYLDDFYSKSEAKDPFCDVEGEPYRVRRGGGFNGSDRGARSANRRDRHPDGDGRALGCRPVIEFDFH